MADQDLNDIPGVRVQSDEEKNERAKLQEAVELQDSLKRADILRDLREQIASVNAKTTAAQENVREAAAEVAPAPPSRIVPAGEGARTHPADLSEVRYRTSLPKWQRDFRNADDDHVIGEYFRALGRGLAGQADLARIMDADRKVRADLTAGGSTSGGPFDGTAGQTIPLPLANYINIAMYRQARFRGLVQVTPATTGVSLRIPLQSTISSATWKAENTVATGGEGTIVDELSLELKNLTSLGVLTRKLINGSVFNVANWLVTDMTMQMAEQEDVSLYQDGDGTLEPNGFEAADTVGTTTPVGYYIPTVTQAADFDLATTLSFEHFAKMFYSLPEKERRNAIWAAPDTVMQTISTVVDGSGRPIFNQQDAPGSTVGDAEASAQVGTILGRPVHNLPGAEGAPATDGTTNRLYFMNPTRSYAILENPNIAVDVSTEAEFTAGNIVYRFIREVDGGVIGNNIAGRPQYVFTSGITGPAAP